MRLTIPTLFSQAVHRAHPIPPTRSRPTHQPQGSSTRQRPPAGTWASARISPTVRRRLQYELEFESRATPTRSTTCSPLPTARRGTLSFTQPLWRNFRLDSNRKQHQGSQPGPEAQRQPVPVDAYEHHRQNSAGVLGSHQHHRELRHRQPSVELARITVANNKKKVEIGTSAPIDVTSSLATQASREVDLISAEERILTRPEQPETADFERPQFRYLVQDDRSDRQAPDSWNTKSISTRRSRHALKNRPELEQSDINLTKNDLTYQLNQNSKKWQVDLNALPSAPTARQVHSPIMLIPIRKIRVWPASRRLHRSLSAACLPPTKRSLRKGPTTGTSVSPSIFRCETGCSIPRWRRRGSRSR